MSQSKFVIAWDKFVSPQLNLKHHLGKNRVLPDLNNYLNAMGRHPQVGAKLKKDYMMFVCNAIRKQLPKLHITKKVKIHYQHYEADRKRDPSNCASMATKVIEDALQTCGVITNDGWANIAEYSQSFDIDKENPRIEVYIEEVDSGQIMMEF